MTPTETAPETKSELTTTTEQRPARLDPFDLIDAMQDDMARFWNQPWSFGWPLRRLATAIRSPRTDVYTQDGKLVVKADLPGLKKEDIAVSLDQGDLVIQAEG